MNTKGIITLAAIGGAVYFGNKLLRTAHVGDKLNIRYLNTRLYSITAKGIEIRTDVLLQNPTTNRLTLTQPFVRLLKGNQVVASSKMENNLYKIEKLSETTIKDLSISTTFAELATSIWQQAFALIQGKSLKEAIKGMNLNIEYSTYANGIPYSKITPITI